MKEIMKNDLSNKEFKKALLKSPLYRFAFRLLKNETKERKELLGHNKLRRTLEETTDPVLIMIKMIEIIRKAGKEEANAKAFTNLKKLCEETKKISEEEDNEYFGEIS